MRFIHLEGHRFWLIFILLIILIGIVSKAEVNKLQNIKQNVKENKNSTALSQAEKTPLPTTPTIASTLPFTSSPIPTSTPTTTITLYPVTKVIDGDTINVKIDDQIKTIRVIGINSPETVDPRRPVECFGKEASEKAKKLLIGKNVRLENDPTQGDTDKYGRLLRYIFLEDGTDFGLTLIKEGYAYEYTYNIPYKYQKQYKQAQKEAEENKRGLWADNVCITPANTPIPTPAQTSVNFNTTSDVLSPAPATEIQTITQTSNFVCNCSKTCSQMSSCEEAYFQLNNCGCQARDGDKDGVPCENLCQ
ncbi:MAG: thermonuclease family protein [Patescibacteria group bacterium]|nr:thermonuclease family protein [Patescibacteria group bacterium]